MEDKRLEIVMLLFPGVTAQDFIGPHTIFSPFSNIKLCWKDKSPVSTDSGMQIIPNATFGECAGQYDMLLVPGGPPENVARIAGDKEVQAFLNDLAERSRYISSVCTGALILGAAGLLKGYRAATHWAAFDSLATFGATPVRERVVADRNRVTGGGVTAGLDFGLTILAELKGEKIAKLAQLLVEYDPAPPFNCGSPKTADKDVLEMFKTLKA